VPFQRMVIVCASAELDRSPFIVHVVYMNPFDCVMSPFRFAASMVGTVCANCTALNLASNLLQVEFTVISTGS
jgi:hypothetical protein